MATIGDRIRDLRKTKGLTQHGLATLVGVSPGYRCLMGNW